MTDDDQRYFRDVYDHLIRIGDMVDTYRDLLTGAMDVYLSTVSNRLNARDEAARDHRHRVHAAHVPDRLLRAEPRAGWSPTSAALGHFLVFGIGLELMTLAIVLGYFWRRGWLQPVRPGRR